MGSAIDTGVTGGVPNLLGSLLASARLLPDNTDWKAFGTAHTPENCGKPWLWQQCSAVQEIAAAPAVDEMQHLSITFTDGGFFDVTFDGQTVVNIAYGESAANVQLALETLPNVSPGDIVVTGGPDDYDFDFSGGQYAGVNVTQIIVDCSDLTGPEQTAPVDLLTADTYGVLAGSTVTNVPTAATVIDGDLGLDPGSAVTGFPLGVVTGTTHVNDAAAIQAKADLVTAYNDAASRATDFLLPPDIGGSTLVPGVYTTDGTPTSLGITGTVTLDAEGDPNAVWIFQIESTLITAPGAAVALINGAQACNVFWQVGSSATLDTTTDFKGTILALTSITANTGANVEGRLLARNAAVTLDENDVTVPTCIVAPESTPTCLVTTTTQGAAAVEESFVDKPLNPGQAAVEFKPFLIEYNSQSCPDGIPVDWQKHGDRAKRGLSVRLSNGLAQYLSSSEIAGDPILSPTLPTVAEDITPVSGAGQIVCTLAGLLQVAIDCGATGELFIHGPAWTLPLLLDHHLITQVGGVFKMGPHTVVLDQGFTNEGPVGSDAAVDGQAWFYVSGPIEYATGSVEVLDDTTKGVSPRLNAVNAIAAQLALVRFDPCCVKAALVQVCG